MKWTRLVTFEVGWRTSPEDAAERLLEDHFLGSRVKQVDRSLTEPGVNLLRGLTRRQAHGHPFQLRVGENRVKQAGVELAIDDDQVFQVRCLRQPAEVVDAVHRGQI